MKNLVMKDIPLMKAHTEYYAVAIAGLVEAVASYSNSVAAIGYVYCVDNTAANDYNVMRERRLLRYDDFNADERVKAYTRK